MSNWYGKARTNYVKVKDLAGLKSSLSKFDIELIQHIKQPEYVSFLSKAESGDFDYYFLDEEDNEVDFSFEDFVMPYIEENETLVIQIVGNEKLRYLSGYSIALIRRGSEILSASINLNDIYAVAAKKFNIPETVIAVNQYDYLPDSLYDC